MSKQGFEPPVRGISKLYWSEYRSWWDMKSRCYRKTNPRYLDYGGRGIRVSKRWYWSFRDFLTDMGPKPSSKHSLDRIDNEGHYTPKNCRWATAQKQQRNTRDNRIITFQDQSLCLTEWAEKFNLMPTTLYTRLKRGWSIQEALTTPMGSTHRDAITATINGKTQTLATWFKELGVRPGLVYERMERGWSVEKALLTPARNYRRP